MDLDSEIKGLKSRVASIEGDMKSGVSKAITDTISLDVKLSPELTATLEEVSAALDDVKGRLDALDGTLEGAMNAKIAELRGEFQSQFGLLQAQLASAGSADQPEPAGGATGEAAGATGATPAGAGTDAAAATPGSQAAPGNPTPAK